MSVAWGTRRFVTVRSEAQRPVGEDTWTFEQILPLIMLAAPILTFTEHMTNEEGPGTAPQPHDGTSEQTIDKNENYN